MVPRGTDALVVAWKSSALYLKMITEMEYSEELTKGQYIKIHVSVWVVSMYIYKHDAYRYT